jgi:hypothetical protein
LSAPLVWFVQKVLGAAEVEEVVVEEVVVEEEEVVVDQAHLQYPAEHESATRLLL